MLGQEDCAPPVVVTLPARIDADDAEHAADHITAAFTPGVSVVVADLTSTGWCDGSAIRNLLRAHRKAAVRGGQVRFIADRAALACCPRPGDRMVGIRQA